MTRRPAVWGEAVRCQGARPFRLVCHNKDRTVFYIEHHQSQSNFKRFISAAGWRINYGSKRKKEATAIGQARAMV